MKKYVIAIIAILAMALAAGAAFAKKAADQPQLTVVGPGCIVLWYDLPGDPDRIEKVEVSSGKQTVPIKAPDEVYMITLTEEGELLVAGGSTTSFARQTALEPIRENGSCDALLKRMIEENPFEEEAVPSPTKDL